MATFWQDVRYGIRMLGKSPGFTAIAVLTIALGIGVNTAIFSVVHAVLLKSLPYPQPDRLVVLNETELRTGSMSVAWLNFLDWRTQNRSFQDVAAYRQQHFILTGVGAPTLLRAGEVSAPFFPLLGVKPILGRTFTDAEDRPGAGPTVVLSYNLWRSRLGGDPAILGRTLALDAIPYTVVGVLPPEFKYFDRPTDVYLPVSLESRPQNTAFTDRGNHPGLRVLARLRPEASLSSARTEMETIMRRLEQQYPITNSGERATVIPLYENRFSDIQPALYTLLAAVGLVLLIACANVANLLLARAAARQREFAIRVAIGAGRLRVIRQLLTESVLLSFLGGALGLLAAVWAIGPLVRLAPQNIPRLAETRMDTGVLLFTLGVSVLTGILFGLAPAFQASNLDLNSTLKESGRTGTSGRSRQRLRAGLFLSEVALALVLVIAAGLLIRSLLSALGVNPGFSPDHVLALDVILPDTKYSTGDQRSNFFAQTVERIRNLPGVRSASAVFCPPIGGTCWDSIFLIANRPVPPQAELPQSVFNAAEPSYFQTMQIPLLEGRYFTEADNAKSHPVIIINQSMARRWFSGASPLGKRIKQGWPESDSPYREIVGVVGDTKQDGLDAEQLTEVFLPIAQSPAPSMTLMVRTASEPMTIAASVEKEIHALDNDQPVSAVQSMTQYMEESLTRRKFSTLLLGIFGALALLLASVGIYGVMTYNVTQRTHEIGIRVALGAQRRDVLGLVVGHGLRLALAGIGIGLAAAWVLTRLLASLLFGVTPRDPVTFCCVVALLAGVALVACYVPARRAARVDPMVALRYE